jgi:ferritin-like protein
VSLFEVRKALRQGIDRPKGLAHFFGSRLRAEMALWDEMKHYEALKTRLNGLYQELGQRFVEEAPQEAQEPFRELIEKIRALEEDLKKKEEELNLIVQPETE